MTAPIIIAAGGTGGHLFPAEALAAELTARGEPVALFTDARSSAFASTAFASAERFVLKGEGIAGRGMRRAARGAMQLAAGTWQARAILKRLGARAVVGFGGYPAIPPALAALSMGGGRPMLVLHEQNGVLGRVNQIFARRVAMVACGTWPTDLPAGVTAVHTGNPVRRAILERAGAPYIPPGDYPMSILVIGGSQGARILSDVVPPAISALPEPIRRNVRVSHQARDEDMARVAAYYADEGINADVQPFFNDIPHRMTDAQLVISRAGASSIADISVIGRPAILIPLAIAIRDEQTANAAALVAAGAAILIPEPELEVAPLSLRIAEVLGDPDRALQMSLRALECGRPDATERLVEIVEELA